MFHMEDEEEKGRKLDSFCFLRGSNLDCRAVIVMGYESRTLDTHCGCPRISGQYHNPLSL